MRFLSLRWRLVFSYVFVTALTVLSLGGLALWLLQRNAAQRETEYLTNNAQAVARQVTGLLQSPIAFPSDRYPLQQLATTSAFLGNVQVRILDTQGRILADSGPRSASDQIMWIAPSREQNMFEGDTGPIVFFMMGGDRRAVERVLPQGRRVMVQRAQGPFGNGIAFAPETGPQNRIDTGPTDISARSVSVPITDLGRVMGFVEVSGAPNYVGEALSTARNALSFAALAATILAVLSGFVVSRGLTSPLARLASAAKQMTQGNLSARALVSAPNDNTRDEISQLSEQFNQMAAKLESSFAALSAERDALRRFIADASHELRTPITALKTFNELLQNGAAHDPITRSEFLAESQTQLNRLEWITSNLLNLSRLDAGLITLDLKDQPVRDLLETALTPFRLRAQQQQVQLIIDPPDPTLILRCDLARMQIVLSNLIDNALKFTLAGGQIILGADIVEPRMTDKQNIKLFVRDTGVGILPTDLPHVFERFYRGNSDLNKGGSGLGLAIVKSIVSAHHGSVSVNSEAGRGSVFTVIL